MMMMMRQVLNPLNPHLMENQMMNQVKIHKKRFIAKQRKNQLMRKLK